MNKRTRARARVVSIQRGKREVFCPLLPFNTHFTLTFYRSFFHFVKYHKFHPNCTNLSPYTFKIRKKEKTQNKKSKTFFLCMYSFHSNPFLFIFFHFFISMHFLSFLSLPHLFNRNSSMLFFFYSWFISTSSCLLSSALCQKFLLAKHIIFWLRN